MMNVFVGAPGREFLGSSEVFIILFVTFGPINFINHFYQMATGVDTKTLVGLAARSASIATVAIVLSAIVGSFMLGKWQISVPAIAFTGAIVLFVAAMRSILALYGGPAPDASRVAPSPSTAASHLVFPYIATPYGIAAIIVLLMLAPESATGIYLTLIAVMLINLIMMLFVKPIMRMMGVPLGLLGTVLSVLQVALSIQFAFFAIRTALAQGI
jgi:small neutral amino acid transporter SnatA (MarC family)